MSFDVTSFVSPGTGRPESCEDAVPMAVAVANEVRIAVADGVGGAGGRLDGMTGGALASRELMQRIERELGARPDQPLVAGVENAVRATRDHLAKAMPQSANRMRGTLRQHRAATTLAVARARTGEDSVVVEWAWLGDSRVYLLDRHGLLLLSSDHCEPRVDPFEALTVDPGVSRVVSSHPSRRMTAEARRMMWSRRNRPAILFVATDGLWDPFRTPWELELCILRAIRQSGHLGAFASRLQALADRAKRDDISFAATVLGAEGLEWEAIVSGIIGNEPRVAECLGAPMLIDSVDDLRHKWEEYRIVLGRPMNIERCTPPPLPAASATPRQSAAHHPSEKTVGASGAPVFPVDAANPRSAPLGAAAMATGVHDSMSTAGAEAIHDQVRVEGDSTYHENEMRDGADGVPVHTAVPTSSMPVEARGGNHVDDTTIIDTESCGRQASTSSQMTLIWVCGIYVAGAIGFALLAPCDGRIASAGTHEPEAFDPSGAPDRPEDTEGTDGP